MKIGKENEKLEFKKTTAELKEGVISMTAMLNKNLQAAGVIGKVNYNFQ